MSSAEVSAVTAELAAGASLGDQATWDQLVERYGAMCGRWPAGTVSVFMSVRGVIWQVHRTARP